MHTTISDEEYNECIADCVALYLVGISIDDIVTNPLGPCSGLVGRVDLDALALHVEIAAQAAELSRTNTRWTGKRTDIN